MTVPSQRAAKIKRMYPTLTDDNLVWKGLRTEHKVHLMTHANDAFSESTRGEGDPENLIVAALECAVKEWEGGPCLEWHKDDDSLRVRTTTRFPYERTWAQLTEAQAAACLALGWQGAEAWDATRVDGLSEFNTPPWFKLSEQQKESVQELGYTKSTWNESGLLPDLRDLRAGYLRDLRDPRGVLPADTCKLPCPFSVSIVSF